MNEHPVEQDVVVLIKNMQQHLVLLEKKIDTLINQSQAKPFRERHFSKPFRPFDRPHRRFDREHNNTSEERSFERAPRHFEKRRGEENRYGSESRHGGESRHGEESRYGAEKRGFDPKKKPFSFRRKSRKF